MKANDFLILLLIILSFGAIAGGGSFILFPEGYLEMTPETLLIHSPFFNFLIPGIILFCMLGLLPLFVVWGLLLQKDCKIAEAVNIFPDMHWAWSWTIYIGFALFIWIFMEVYFIQAFSWLQFFYFFYGILIVVVALFPSIRKQYQKVRKEQ